MPRAAVHLPGVQPEGVASSLTDAAARILVIRRDNIGDLVCTLPLLRALRTQLPRSQIAALVNSYNAPVLSGHPDVDRVFVYQKAKHRAQGESLLGTYWQRARMVIELRAMRFDWALLPGGPQPSAERFARWISARHHATPATRAAGLHEVEQSCSLLPSMGLRYETPPARLQANQACIRALRERLHALSGWGAAPVIGIHIGARKPSQRWPAEHFTRLIDRLAESGSKAFILLWAPGPGHNALHPGDDEKAAGIAGRLAHRPLVPVASQRLEELIAAVALCDHFICSDGGAMHLAAALGKPIVCLFGDSDPARWHPWNVPHELLQASSRDVADITVEDVVLAYERLCARLEREPAS